MGRGPIWAYEEKEVLIKYYGAITMDKIMDLLPNRSRSSIESQLNALREHGYPIRQVNRTPNTFTQQEVDIVVNYYGKLPVDLILKMMPGRDAHQLAVKAGNLRAKGINLPKYESGPRDGVEKPYSFWLSVGGREMYLQGVMGFTLKGAQQRSIKRLSRNGKVVFAIDGPSKSNTRQSSVRQREFLRIEF